MNSTEFIIIIICRATSLQAGRGEEKPKVIYINPQQLPPSHPALSELET